MRKLPVALVALATACVHDAIPPRQAPTPAIALDEGTVRQTLILVGDAGETRADDPLLRAVRAAADARPERTTVVFLGDNVYDHGLPDSASRAFAGRAAVLRAQLQAAGRARVVLVPGNHDWDREDAAHAWSAGPPALGRQARFVAREGGARATFAPYPGCAGPTELSRDGAFRVLAIDSQWWLTAAQSVPNGIPDAAADPSCAPRSLGDATARLRAMLARGDGRPVVVIAHHPLATNGQHARTGLVALFKRSPQDLRHPKNRELRDSLAAAMRAAPPLLYASGHDHDVELFGGLAATWAVVSGAASTSKLTGFWTHDGPTLGGARGPGYVRVDALDGGRVALRMIVLRGGGESLVLCRWLAPASLADRSCGP